MSIISELEEGVKVLTTRGEGTFICWTSKLGKIVTLEINGEKYQYVPVSEIIKVLK